MTLLRDTKLMFVRNMQHTLRSPVFVFVSMFQPLMYLLLFMPLLNSLGGVPGLPPGKTVDIFIPGLLVLQALFGTAFVGFSLIDDIRSGVIERFLVTPVKRPAILLGRVLRDAVVLAFAMRLNYVGGDSVWVERKHLWVFALVTVVCSDWNYYGVHFLWFRSYLQN